MVFGTFDGIHDGHREFLRQAKSYGDYLIAVLPQDHIVELLKNHLPNFKLTERIRMLREEKLVDEAVAGDSAIKTWGIVKKHRPDIIVFGYDQVDLKKALEEKLPEFDWPVEIKTAGPHEPDKFHSSLMRPD